jgi:hypothetical protein
MWDMLLYVGYFAVCRIAGGPVATEPPRAERAGRGSAAARNWVYSRFVRESLNSFSRPHIQFYLSWCINKYKIKLKKINK